MMIVLNSLLYFSRNLAMFGLFIVSLLVSKSVLADPLDELAKSDPFLMELVDKLHSVGVDVAGNLSDRDFGRSRPEIPRLGGFADLPVGTYPISGELEEWERSYQDGEIKGLAVFECSSCQLNQDAELHLESWFASAEQLRLFVTFAAVDLPLVNEINAQLQEAGLNIVVFKESEQQELAAEFYSTSGRRFAIDTRESRRLNSDVTEIQFLGERVRRNSNSIFRETDSRWGLGVARNEPSVFMKESLGDEFNQSTIEEIVVPGGVALGETAQLSGVDFSEVAFSEGVMTLLDEGQSVMAVDLGDVSKAKALFDFVLRSMQVNSDAIVDIDGDGKVRISSALRDTDAGYEIMHADTMPFKYVRHLPVTKSVIIDTFVSWKAKENAFADYVTEFEVRFLSADNMRIAQTRAALVYEYESSSQEMDYRDNWGKESRRLNEKIDYTGLGDSLREVAQFAAWSSLFRYIEENDIPFLKGRYDFMKIDKQGRRTPLRY